MLFGDYLKLVKNSFSDSITDEYLCRLLFDSIITPLNLTSRTGDLLDYDKNKVSDIVTGRRNIPSQIKSNIYNKEVTKRLAEYFEINISPELVPDKTNLIQGMLSLFESNEFVSVSERNSLLLLSSQTTIAAFLAQAFCLAIQYNDYKSTISELDVNRLSALQSPLYLAGIHLDETTPGSFYIDSFSPKGIADSSELFKEIASLFSQIAKIHLPLKAKDTSNLFQFINKEPIVISDDRRSVLTQVASKLEIELPNDFFDLGDLSRNPLRSTQVLVGGTDLEGSSEAFEKYQLYDELETAISDYCEWGPIEKTFSGIHCIQLAIFNSGNKPDQNIAVTLKVPANSIMTPTDIANLDNEILNNLLSDYHALDLFAIPSTVSYLDYESSMKKPSLVGAAACKLPSTLYRKTTLDRHEIEDELQTVFNDYQFFTSSDSIIIKTEFDEIMHNTIVAFPTVLLLNHDIESIEYSIRSRNMEDVFNDSLTLTSDS
ncbi:MAG: hypothetical protein Q4C80_07425 [Bacillota bacterium]|nr:hypothetical protein [Bacillota bacterium]